MKTLTDEEFRAICRKSDEIFKGAGTPSEKYRKAKENIDAEHKQGVSDEVCANLENYAYGLYQQAVRK